MYVIYMGQGLMAVSDFPTLRVANLTGLTVYCPPQVPYLTTSVAASGNVTVCLRLQQ